MPAGTDWVFAVGRRQAGWLLGIGRRRRHLEAPAAMQP